jgi:hypothetical protein
VYYENLIMKSGVGLKSESGPDATIIDGAGGRCLECVHSSFGTSVEGFTLTHAGGYSAGAVWIFDQSNVEISGCVIRDNHTSYEGAGVQVQRYSHGYIHDNQFINNRSYHSCAIVVIVSSQAVITNNLFKNNVAEFLSGGIGINAASADIQGNFFIGNESVHGATIHVVHSGTFARIEHNSFVFNRGSSDGGSGIYAYSGGEMIAANNIFAFNEGRPAVLSNGGVMHLACNDFWENATDFQGVPNPIGVNGNMLTDPMICDPLSDDVALSAYSPCLTGTCGLIGANPVPACLGEIPGESMSWGEVKSQFR